MRYDDYLARRSSVCICWLARIVVAPLAAGAMLALEAVAGDIARQAGDSGHRCVARSVCARERGEAGYRCKKVIRGA